MSAKRESAEQQGGRPDVGVDDLFAALTKTDRCCRLIVKQLREAHPYILEGPELDRLVKLSRRQFRENRELLGTGPDADESTGEDPSNAD